MTSRQPIPFEDVANLPDNTPLTPAMAAAFSGLKVTTLEQWRSLGEGPPFYRRQRVVRYKLGELRAWLLDPDIRCEPRP